MTPEPSAERYGMTAYDAPEDVTSDRRDRDAPSELAECPFCHALGLKERIEGEHFCEQMQAVNDR